MNSPLSKSDILALSVADRLALIEQVWDTLDEADSSIPMPDWHRTVLDDRIAAHERNPEAARPWDEVKAELLDALRK